MIQEPFSPRFSYQIRDQEKGNQRKRPQLQADAYTLKKEKEKSCRQLGGQKAHDYTNLHARTNRKKINITLTILVHPNLVNRTIKNQTKNFGKDAQSRDERTHQPDLDHAGGALLEGNEAWSEGDQSTDQISRSRRLEPDNIPHKVKKLRLSSH